MGSLEALRARVAQRAQRAGPQNAAGGPLTVGGWFCAAVVRCTNLDNRATGQICRSGGRAGNAAEEEQEV